MTELPLINRVVKIKRGFTIVTAHRSAAISSLFRECDEWEWKLSTPFIHQQLYSTP